MGQFYYAAKAFDVLERLDPNPEYWEGKRGACVGVFQMILAGHEPRYGHRLYTADHLYSFTSSVPPMYRYVIFNMRLGFLFLVLML